MKSTLSELWYGSIRPQSEIPENDQKNQELRRNLDLSYDILWNKLDDDGKQILDQLQTYHTELSLRVTRIIRTSFLATNIRHQFVKRLECINILSSAFSCC